MLFLNTELFLSIHQGLVPRQLSPHPVDTKIRRCANPLYKKVCGTITPLHNPQIRKTGCISKKKNISDQQIPNLVPSYVLLRYLKVLKEKCVLEYIKFEKIVLNFPPKRDG